MVRASRAPSVSVSAEVDITISVSPFRHRGIVPHGTHRAAARGSCLDNVVSAESRLQRTVD
jgi:hypothetical protein